MIVVDASAAIEWLLDSRKGKDVRRRTLADQGTLHAPQLLDLEVCQVLRRFVREGHLRARRAEQALQDLMDAPIRRYPHVPFVRRVWELRGNFTAYDAVYVALAEVLGATLLTCDEKLAAAPYRGARLELV